MPESPSPQQTASSAVYDVHIPGVHHLIYDLRRIQLIVQLVYPGGSATLLQKRH